MLSRESRRGRGLWAVVAAVGLAVATVGVGGASVGADDGPSIPDVPSLGFSIDPSQGEVGSTVDGEVNVDDVANHCITDPQEFVEQFLGDYVDGFFTGQSSYIAAINGTFDDIMANPDADPAMRAAWMVAGAFPSALGLDFQDEDGGETIGGAIAQTLIMGFADLATASPIAPYGTFDPTSGEGSTPVPDVEAGSQIVIATCVGLPEEVTTEAMLAALEDAAEYIVANYDEPYPAGPGAPGFEEFTADVAPVILVNLVEPLALGIASFCVDDGEGSCDEPDNGNGNGAGNGDGNGDGSGNGSGDGNGSGSGAGGTATPATPVSGSPTYTG